MYIKNIHPLGGCIFFIYTLHFSLVHFLKVLFTVKHAVVCGKKVLFTVKHVVECRRKVLFTVKQWSTKNPCQDCKATQSKQRKIEQHRSMHALSSLRNDLQDIQASLHKHIIKSRLLVVTPYDRLLSTCLPCKLTHACNCHLPIQCYFD